ARARRRAARLNPNQGKGTMTNTDYGTPALPDLTQAETLRYSRHLIMPEVGPEGQRKLKAAKVLLVGAGGLGSPSALYLAAAGVGTLGLVDFDVVDESNLHRQVLFGTKDVGRPKLEAASERIRDMNPNIRVVQHPERLTSENALDVLAGYDIIIDGTDNFPTRYLVNDACVLLGKPNVYGSIFRWEGQVSVFATEGGPCYRCLFRQPPPPGLVPNCAEDGVLGVLPGIIGSAQTLEVIKLLLGVGRTLAGRLLIFDALDLSWREVALRRNPECPVCGDEATQAELHDYEVFCGVAPAAGSAEGAAAGTGAHVGANGDRADTLDPVLLAERLAADPAPFLLDVRHPWEWAVSNLSDLGARLVPLDELEQRLAEIPRDRPIIVYCKSGGRSARAAGILTERGFGPVSNLEGGLARWAERVGEGFKVA